MYYVISFNFTLKRVNNSSCLYFRFIFNNEDGRCISSEYVCYHHYGDKLEHNPRLGSVINTSLSLSLSATRFLNLFITELVANLYHKVLVGYGVQEISNSPTISPTWSVTLQLDFVLSYRFHLSRSQSPSFWHSTARFNYSAVGILPFKAYWSRDAPTV